MLHLTWAEIRTNMAGWVSCFWVAAHNRLFCFLALRMSEPKMQKYSMPLRRLLFIIVFVFARIKDPPSVVCFRALFFPDSFGFGVPMSSIKSLDALGFAKRILPRSRAIWRTWGHNDAPQIANEWHTRAPKWRAVLAHVAHILCVVLVRSARVLHMLGQRQLSHHLDACFHVVLFGAPSLRGV